MRSYLTTINVFAMQWLLIMQENSAMNKAKALLKEIIPGI